jgi:anti-anti-sigma regulatory factor
VLVVRPDRGVTYAAAEHVKHRVTKSCARFSSLVVVLDGTHVHALDTTAVKVKINKIMDSYFYYYDVYIVTGAIVTDT